MPRPITYLYSAVDALVAAAVGLGVPLIAVVAVQLATAGFGSDFLAGFQYAAAVWALSLGGFVNAAIDPSSGLLPAGSEAIAFTLRVMPLGLTLITVWLARVTGVRIRAGSDMVWPGLLFTTAVFSACAAGVSIAATGRGIDIGVWQTTIVGAVIFLGSAFIGARAWQVAPIEAAVSSLETRGRALLTQGLRAAGIMITGVLGAGAVLLVIAVVVGLASVLALFQSLPLDVTSAIVVGLSQLVIAVNGVVWSAAWMLGTGFALGTGSSVTPTETLVGPMPVVPLLGAISASPPLLAISVIAVPVLVGLAAMVGVRMHAPAGAARGVWSRISVALVAAGVAAVAIGVLALAAGGSAGPGRLADVGPFPLLTGASAFGTLALGALVGALVPLSAEEFDDDADESDRRRDARENDEPVDATSTAKATAKTKAGSRTASSRASANAAKRDAPAGASTAPASSGKGASGAAKSSAAKRRSSRDSADERPWVADAVSKRFEDPGESEKKPGTALEVRADDPPAERQTSEIRRAKRLKVENPRYDDEPDIYADIDIDD
ncbi:hypothetical protein HDC34_001259 [Pseudoclavibacter sp. JAI123]|uniref:cell division protein PerM n=1 Tax=Pseudoclavibacter sp. JAI123 TaxID=2723065 RepID=UPI0015CBD078|nr:DUF6350 family protein [Pseudoclavibacter sp. JAI123]NYF12965.1 hypothetical protein [Pseudoclavibacter sp. JAI123]